MDDPNTLFYFNFDDPTDLTDNFFIPEVGDEVVVNAGVVELAYRAGKTLVLDSEPDDTSIRTSSSKDSIQRSPRNRFKVDTRMSGACT